MLKERAKVTRVNYKRKIRQKRKKTRKKRRRLRTHTKIHDSNEKPDPWKTMR